MESFLIGKKLLFFSLLFLCFSLYPMKYRGMAFNRGFFRGNALSTTRFTNTYHKPLKSSCFNTRFMRTNNRASKALNIKGPVILGVALGVGAADWKKYQSAIEKEENAVLGDRPSQIQAEADKAFELNKDTGDDQWLYNGFDFYGLLGINDKLLLKHLASENQEKEDVYIIDVGCARGGWGRHAMRILQSKACKKSGKRFHIFSVTGGKECEEIVQQEGHVTLYQLNRFKIENIDEELSKRGFDLKGKVDLIVSNWTLRHLVDPFGTLKRMYSLLTSNQGMLLSNGFLFKFNDSDKVRAFPEKNENILIHANATPIFRAWDCGRDTGQFLLMRNNKKELEIPLEYTSNISFISHRYQCASAAVTVFNKGSLVKQNFDPDFIEGSPKLYCDKDDQQCKNLYKDLKARGYFMKRKYGGVVGESR